jgi:hypothetical protein
MFCTQMIVSSPGLFQGLSEHGWDLWWPVVCSFCNIADPLMYKACMLKTLRVWPIVLLVSDVCRRQVKAICYRDVMCVEVRMLCKRFCGIKSSFLTMVCNCRLSYFCTLFIVRVFHTTAFRAVDLFSSSHVRI